MNDKAILSRKARRDIDNITDFTLETWGDAQMVKYIMGLNATISQLGDNPKQGRRRSDLMTGMRMYPNESHIIYYVPGKGSVTIVRVLHQSQNAAAHIQGADK